MSKNYLKLIMNGIININAFTKVKTKDVSFFKTIIKMIAPTRLIKLKKSPLLNILIFINFVLLSEK